MLFQDSFRGYAVQRKWWTAVDLPPEIVAANMKMLAKATSEIASDGFGTFQPSPRYMAEMLATGNLLVAVIDGLPVGFIHYSVHTDLGERYIGESRAIKKAHQGKHLGSYMLHYIFDATGATGLRAQTQNPYELYSSYSVLRQLGCRCVYPIDATYDTSERASAMLRIEVDKWGMDPATVDFNKGIHYGAFTHEISGKFGDYDLNTTHPGVLKVNQRMLELGIARDQGDALIYVGFTN